MKASRHIIASSFAGLTIGLLMNNLYVGVICWASGVLSDVDHIIEFIIHHGVKEFSIKNFFQAFKNAHKRQGKYKFEKFYLFFHIAEVAILFWGVLIWTRNIYLLAIAAGYSLHLIMDVRGNYFHPYYYFMTWRILKNFDVDRVMRVNIDNNKQLPK